MPGVTQDLGDHGLQPGVCVADRVLTSRNTWSVATLGLAEALEQAMFVEPAEQR